jgi:dipeptidase
MKRILFCCGFWLLTSVAALACTIIAAGKKATVDGSVILSHTDAGINSRILYVPPRTFAPGEKAPVYWGHQDTSRAVDDFGEVLGAIPQVERTFGYFHSAYSHINEKGLAIAESTTSQRPELGLDKGEGEQIMTIEQAMIFALERCSQARDAVRLIGSLLEEHGFLPSTGGESEDLVIGDSDEAWVFEAFSVGKGWKKASGKPGAIWAAQRIADEYAVMIPNWSIIKDINPKDTSRFMACSRYKQEAIDRGWYDPASGRPFVWQEAYTPLPGEYATSRFWLFATTFAPKAGPWPDRTLDPKDPAKALNNYFQIVEPLTIYPFSLKPEKPISVQQIIAFQRSWMDGTVYDMSAEPQWLVPDGKGGMVKSPLATPFPSRDLRALLKLVNRRPVARHRGHYGMVAHLRGGMPAAIGSVYWVYLDNPTISPYVPIYAGSTATAKSYQVYNPESFDDASARWTIDFVDNLANTRFQDAIKDVAAAREPFEKAIFERLPALEQQALALYQHDPGAARAVLTEYCVSVQEQVPGLYKKLREQLITKYTNNRE